VRSLGVIKCNETIQVFLQLPDRAVELGSEGDLIELLVDGSVEPFDETVRPRVTDFGVSVDDPIFPERLLETMLLSPPAGCKFGSIVREHVSHRDAAGVLDNFVEEVHGGGGGLIGKDFRPTVAGAGINTGHLIDSTDPFDTTDVEGVDAHQLAGEIGVDMA